MLPDLLYEDVQICSKLQISFFLGGKPTNLCFKMIYYLVSYVTVTFARIYRRRARLTQQKYVFSIKAFIPAAVITQSGRYGHAGFAFFICTCAPDD